MEEKVDRLFLEKDCPYCGVVRAELKMEAASSDAFRGLDGQRLMVFSALSNSAAKELLDKFGLAGREMPVLVTWEGEVRTGPQQVLAWMRKHGISEAG
jgi:hypothetical protein